MVSHQIIIIGYIIFDCGIQDNNSSMLHLTWIVLKHKRQLEEEKRAFYTLKLNQFDRCISSFVTVFKGG